MKQNNILAIVDDEQLFREGISMILKYRNEFDLKYSLGSGEELIELINDPEKENPSLILLDLKMKGINGIETARQVIALDNRIKIIVLSTYYDESFFKCLFDIGVHAYMAKNTDADKLIFTILQVINNGYYFDQKSLQMMKSTAKNQPRFSNGLFEVPNLTKRETQILKLICRQLTTQQIADELSLSIRTIEGHRANLFEKTNTKNMVGLVIYAIMNNLVNLDMMIVEEDI
jgi:DNA-binding NarL/FixJ family response regulator